MKNIKTILTLTLVLFLALPISGLAQEFTETEKQILQNLDLNQKEKELLKDINELKIKAEIWISESEKIDNEITELKQICELSENFSDIKNKAKRKINRFLDTKLALLYDAEEFFEMANDLRYTLYKNHWHEISGETEKDWKTKADDIFNKAKDIRYNVYENLDMKDGAGELKKARKIENKAILTQLNAYAENFNIDTEYGFFADLNSNETKGKSITEPENATKVKDEENIINKNLVIKTAKNSRYSDLEELENDKYLYRVQVGAFLNKVSKDEFHGLYPLTVEKNKSIFTKYLVGRYFSHEAAIKAMNVIKKNTEYKDAFVVAYKNGNRMQHEFLNNALSSSK